MTLIESFKRALTPPGKSFFLFGPRGVGKTTWVNQNFPDCLYIDLLDTRLFLKLSKDPGLLEAMIGKISEDQWVCIDEIQKIPMLLNEVQRLMKKSIRFVLTGSSARKLKRAGANLLGGRAITMNMEGLVIHELSDHHSIDQLISLGTLPLVLNEPEFALETLEAYIAIYIKEEIREEGAVRKIDPFLRFLEIAGMMNGQKISYQNIARDALVPASNVQNYFSILVDTLIGHMLPAYRPSAKVREVSRPKFYWFDPGVARAAAGIIREPIDNNTLGFALETLIFHELRVYNFSQKKFCSLYYYETGAGVEIDFIVELKKKTLNTKAHVVSIEVKHSRQWKRQWEKPSRDLATSDQVIVQRAIGIYRGNMILQFDNFTVYPIDEFLKALYAGQVF